MSSLSAIEHSIYEAFQDYKANLVAANRSGSFDLDISISCDLSKNATSPKFTVKMRHYQYSKFNSDTDIKGISMKEVFNELQRQLGRDDKMLLLSKPKEEDTDEVPF